MPKQGEREGFPVLVRVEGTLGVIKSKFCAGIKELTCHDQRLGKSIEASDRIFSNLNSPNEQAEFLFHHCTFGLAPNFCGLSHVVPC